MYKFLLILLLVPAEMMAQTSLPGYFDVLHKFFSNYNFEYQGKTHLLFAKKKDGWHVMTRDAAQTDVILSDELYWESATRKWHALKNFDKGEAYRAEEKVTFYINSPSTEYTAFGFERCRYYGYSGWDIDMLHDLRKTTTMTDTLLEGMARAHDAFASRYLWYQYGGQLKNPDTLQRELGRLELPSDQRVQALMVHLDKSTGYYRTLAERNPAYTTLIGKIGMKYFNENFHAYMQLQFCDRVNESKQYLDRCRLGYDDSLAADNTLQSVADNGILFTFGDNDTYPLMYLQLKCNVRTDVTVLNTSLLGFTAYLQWLNRNKLVAFKTPASAYGKKTMDFAFYNIDDTSKMAPVPLQSFLASREQWPEQSYSNGESYQLYNVKHLSMADSIRIELGEYISMSDHLMLDIIQENWNKRPVFFASSNPSYFENYLVPAGIVYQLVQDPQWLPVAAMEAYLNHRYKPPFRNFTGASPEYDNYVYSHFALYSTLIYHYQQAEDAAKVDALIKQCFAPFKKKMPYLFKTGAMIDLVYKAGHPQLGDALSNEFIRTIVARSLKKNALYYQDRAVGKTILQELQTTLRTYDRDLKLVNDGIARLSD